MTSTTDFQAEARAETLKRLLAQLVNEELARLDLTVFSATTRKWQGCIFNKGDSKRQIKTNVTDAAPRPIWRPSDFDTPVCLSSDDSEQYEDDPGAIFEFICPWLPCGEETKGAIACELRNCVAMLEKWMQFAVTQPALDLNSSFIAWERSLITGHPSHPFHRTCFADKLLSPVTPDNVPNMLNPGLSFVTLPLSSVHIFGSFERLTAPLLQLLGVPCSAPEDRIIVPCLSQHLPAVRNFFPEAELLASVPSCAEAQASIRSVSVPGYAFDLKFSLACLITSALRILPSWTAAAAPHMTSILREVLPAELWVFGEVAAITGSQNDPSKSRQLTCILRENLEARADANDEMLVLVSALMEKPLRHPKTHAERLFGLGTTTQKVQWFTSYLQCLLRLALHPLQHHGIGCEMHAQNTVARICRKTKQIKGFAVRDLAGVKIHKTTLQAHGFDTSGVANLCTDDIHQVWDRVHHSLFQNNIGFMLYALGLETTEFGWELVRSTLSTMLESDDTSTAKGLYSYLVKDMMPFKCFIRMRMATTPRSRMALVERERPNLLSKPSGRLAKIFLDSTNDQRPLASPT